LSLLAKYALLHLKSNRRLIRNWEEVGKPRFEGKDVSAIDWSVDTRSIEEALANEKEPVLRQELIMQYDELNALEASSTSADSLKKWLLEIPATSPAWVYHMNLAWASSLVCREDALQYLNDIIARHPNELFAKLIYDNAMSGCCGSGCSAVREKKYSSTRWSSQARPQLPMSRVGDPVTHFELRSIDDSTKTISEKSMTGRIYMIDFWATWNEPSVTEMPYLHKAFERFKNQGLTIISVSMDDSSSIVSKYRKDNWAMPWQNAMESSHTTGSLRWSFGVWSIPFPMLVSSQGIILALGDDLKGENLQRTLEKFIGK
jgi:thiol-disulfide isomerase/thioredoxin